MIIQSPRLKPSKHIERVVSEKFQRFEQLSDRIIRCDILLKKEKDSRDDGFIVEAKLAVPGRDLFAKESAAKFEIAAEKVCEDLERQLRKHKVIGKK